MEYWDIVDKDGNPTGKQIKRGKITLRRGEYHPVVHIWVFYNNKFLIQKREEKQESAMVVKTEEDRGRSLHVWRLACFVA